MEAQRLNGAKLAELTGVTRAAISALLTGKSAGGQILGSVADALNVSLKWLQTGDLAHAPSWTRHPDDAAWQDCRTQADQAAGDDDLADVGAAFPTPHQRDRIIEVAERHLGRSYSVEERAVVVRGWLRAVQSASLDAPAQVAVLEGPDKLSVFGTVAASDGRSFGVAFDTAQVYRWKKDRFLVRITGDSLMPLAMSGQFVICDPDRSIRHNSIVLVQTTDGDLVKRWCEDARAPGGGVYASINAGFDSPWIDPVTVLRRWAVVGVIFE